MRRNSDIKTCKKYLSPYYAASLKNQSYPPMESLFSALDTLLELPFPAFEKRLVKFEEEFRNLSISDVSEEELE